jgi:hypothetical protein
MFQVNNTLSRSISTVESFGSLSSTPTPTLSASWSQAWVAEARRVGFEEEDDKLMKILNKKSR